MLPQRKTPYLVTLQEKSFSHHRDITLKKPNLIILAFQGVLFAVATILAGCGPSAEPPAPPPPSVSVLLVKERTVAERNQYIGRTSAFRSVDIKARVEGLILKRSFTEGDAVEEGQLLFQLDDSAYKAAYARAEANLKASEAALINAERALKRGQDLLPQGYISQSDMDNLLSTRQQADATHSANLAALESARIDLDHTLIRAPFSGKISKARYSEGNLVNSTSESLATLIQDDPIYANFQITEKRYIDFNQQNTVDTDPNEYYTTTMNLPNGTDYPIQGRINYTATEGDSNTGTIDIRAEFPNPDGLIKPGLYVTVTNEARKTEQLPLIPQYAVQESQLGKFVLVVNDDNTIGQRVITTGDRYGAFWVVKEGLQPGELIIVEGLQKVRIGQAVNPVMKVVDFDTGTLSSMAATAALPTDPTP